MEDIDSSPLAPNPKKRAAPEEEDSPEKRPLNLKGTQFMMPTPPDTDNSSNASPSYANANDDAARAASPAPSSSALSSVDVASSHPEQDAVVDLTSSNPAAASSGPPPKKKRKLTFAEKEQQKQEKAVRDAEKAAEKARKDAVKAAEKIRKDEEKARKDEEKRIKDEEKRRKAEVKEAEKREKELKKEQVEQDKLKKERSQMRLGVFFQKPATPAKEGDEENTFNIARRKSLSLEPFDAVADQIRGSESPCRSAAQPLSTKNTPAKPEISDYRKHFLPFQLKTHTSMAPLRLPDDPDKAQEILDCELNDPSLREKYDLGIVDSYASLEQQFANERSFTRGTQIPSTRQLVDQVQSSIQQPIDLASGEPVFNPAEMLQTIQRRHIEFGEDVRPAYFGTYSKIRSPRTMKKVSRNPFSRARPDTDYDYDSEQEWEEPEEGEDILDEDDDEAESIGDAHEMDEFLDDEDDALKNKRKLITGDLVPTSTGLCWENEKGELVIPSIEGGSPLQAMRGMRMGVLLPGFSDNQIDPFSTSYWQNDQTPAQHAPAVKTEQLAALPTDLMPPPRPPLQPRPNSNGTIDHMFGVVGDDSNPIGMATKQTSKPGRKPAPKTLSQEDMEEFKAFVIGSQATKADLLKELKTRFPKLTNELIKSTLSDNFAQVGASKAEKKWGFVSVS